MRDKEKKGWRKTERLKKQEELTVKKISRNMQTESNGVRQL